MSAPEGSDGPATLLDIPLVVKKCDDRHALESPETGSTQPDSGPTSQFVVPPQSQRSALTEPSGP